VVASIAVYPTASFADDAGGEHLAEDEVKVLPCRPTISSTAEIVKAGVLEVETGVARRHSADAPVNTVQVLVKYSVTDRLQLQLGTNNLVMAQGSDTHTVDGVYGGTKLVLREQSERAPAISVSALVMVPTRDGATAATQTTDGYFWAYVTKDLGFMQADFNVGLDVLSIDHHPAVQELVALSLSRDLAYGVGAMLEGYTFEDGGDYADPDAGILMALSYALTPRIVFDAGVDFALYRDTRYLTLFGGVTFALHHPDRARPHVTANRR
jgi:hypothetical protein